MEEDCIGCQGPQWTIVLHREREKEEEGKEEETLQYIVKYSAKQS
jgi:hypothetical protein